MTPVWYMPGALALEMPAITCDFPPMNEVVEHGTNGLLVPVHTIGRTNSGVFAVEPDVKALREAMWQMRDASLRAELRDGARRRKELFSWGATVQSLADLLA